MKTEDAELSWRKRDRFELSVLQIESAELTGPGIVQP